jgi:hypothetical protein
LLSGSSPNRCYNLPLGSNCLEKVPDAHDDDLWFATAIDDKASVLFPCTPHDLTELRSSG